jgi:hypothetical protein
LSFASRSPVPLLYFSYSCSYFHSIAHWETGSPFAPHTVPSRLLHPKTTPPSSSCLLYPSLARPSDTWPSLNSWARHCSTDRSLRASPLASCFPSLRTVPPPAPKSATRQSSLPLRRFARLPRTTNPDLKLCHAQPLSPSPPPHDALPASRHRGLPILWPSSSLLLHSLRLRQQGGSHVRKADAENRTKGGAHIQGYLPVQGCSRVNFS